MKHRKLSAKPRSVVATMVAAVLVLGGFFIVGPTAASAEVCPQSVDGPAAPCHPIPCEVPFRGLDWTECCDWDFLSEDDWRPCPEPPPPPPPDDDPGPTPDDDPGPTPDDDPGPTPDDDPAPTPDEDPGPTPDDDPSTSVTTITTTSTVVKPATRTVVAVRVTG